MAPVTATTPAWCVHAECVMFAGSARMHSVLTRPLLNRANVVTRNARELIPNMSGDPSCATRRSAARRGAADASKLRGKEMRGRCGNEMAHG